MSTSSDVEYKSPHSGSSPSISDLGSPTDVDLPGSVPPPISAPEDTQGTNRSITVESSSVTPNENIPFLHTLKAKKHWLSHSYSTGVDATTSGTPATGTSGRFSVKATPRSKRGRWRKRKKSVGLFSRVPSNIHTFRWTDVLGFEFHAFLLVVLVSFGIASIPLPPEDSGFSKVNIVDLTIWYVTLIICHSFPATTLMLFSMMPYCRERESLPWRQTLTACLIMGIAAVLTEDVLFRTLDSYHHPFVIPAMGATYCVIMSFWIIWERNWQFLETDYRKRVGDFSWLHTPGTSSLDIDSTWIHFPFDEPNLLNWKHWPPLFRRRCVTMFLLMFCAFTYYLVGGVFVIMFVEFAEGGIIAQIITGLTYTAVAAWYRAIAVTAILQYGKVGQWPFVCGCCNNICKVHEKKLSALEEEHSSSTERGEESASSAKQEQIRILNSLQQKSDSRLQKDFEVLYSYWYEFSMAHLYPTIFWTIKWFESYVPGTPKFYEKFNKFLWKYWYRGDNLRERSIDNSNHNSCSRTPVGDRIPHSHIEESILDEREEPPCLPAASEHDRTEPTGGWKWTSSQNDSQETLQSFRGHQVKLEPWIVYKMRWFFLSTTSQLNSAFVFMALFSWFSFGINRSKYPFDFEFDIYVRSMWFAGITGVIYASVLFAGEVWIKRKYEKASVFAVSLNFICYSQRTKMFLFVMGVTTVVLHITYFASTFHSYSAVAPQRYPGY